MSQISIPNGLIRCSMKFCIALPFPFGGLLVITSFRAEISGVQILDRESRSVTSGRFFRGTDFLREFWSLNECNLKQAGPLHLSDDIKLFSFSSRFKLSSTVESGLIVKYTIENIPEKYFSFVQIRNHFSTQKKHDMVSVQSYNSSRSRISQSLNFLSLDLRLIITYLVPI